MQRTCKSSNLCAISYSHLNSPYSSKHTDALSLRSHGRACAIHMPSPLQPFSGTLPYRGPVRFNLRVAISFRSAFLCSVPTRDLTLIYFGYWPFSGLSLSSIFGSCIVIQSGASPLFLLLLCFLSFFCGSSAPGVYCPPALWMYSTQCTFVYYSFRYIYMRCH
jgi:hypothetical protein